MESKALYAQWICLPTHFNAAKDLSAVSVNTE